MSEKILDLTTLFSDEQPIIVKVLDREGNPKDIRLLSPKALGPRKFVKINDVMKSAAKLEKDFSEIDELSTDQAETLERLYDQALALLSEDFSKIDLPFLAKIKVLTFYSAEVNKEQAASAEKNITPAAAI